MLFGISIKDIKQQEINQQQQEISQLQEINQLFLIVIWLMNIIIRSIYIFFRINLIF